MLGASSGRDATRAAAGSGGEGSERRRTADGRQRNPRYARVAGREKKREEKKEKKNGRFVARWQSSVNSMSNRGNVK